MGKRKLKANGSRWHWGKAGFGEGTVRKVTTNVDRMNMGWDLEPSLEKVACPICGIEEILTKILDKDGQKIYRCKNCLDKI